MPIEVLALGFGTLFGIGGIILAGQHLQHRHEERQGNLPDADSVRRLEGAVEDLQEEVQALRDAVGGVEERLDFTERLLSGPTGNRA